jgi:hypothetical protein
VGYEGGEYILNPEIDDMQNLHQQPDQRLGLVVLKQRRRDGQIEAWLTGRNAGCGHEQHSAGHRPDH